MIECRIKCPALTQECWTYNIFYQQCLMSDGYFDPYFLSHLFKNTYQEAHLITKVKSEVLLRFSF